MAPFNNRKDLNWKRILDSQFIGAMGRPGGARNPVDPRFISLFNVFEIQFPANTALSHIYSAILEAHLQKLGADLKVCFSWHIFQLVVTLSLLYGESCPKTYKDERVQN